MGFADVCRISSTAPKRSRDEVWQGDRGDTQGIRPDTDRVVGAAQLAGCRPEDGGALCRGCAMRAATRSGGTGGRKAIDPFLDKIEEWVEESAGKIRADVAHRKLSAMGFTGNERSTQAGGGRGEDRLENRAAPRTYRPWITEPGMWLQFDWGEGPRVGGRRVSCSARGWPGRGSGW